MSRPRRLGTRKNAPVSRDENWRVRDAKRRRNAVLGQDPTLLPQKPARSRWAKPANPQPEELRP